MRLPLRSAIVLMSSFTTIEASSFGMFARIILVPAPLAWPTIENGPDADATSALPATMARKV